MGEILKTQYEISDLEKQVEELRFKREYSDSWELSHKYGGMIDSIEQKISLLKSRLDEEKMSEADFNFLLIDIERLDNEKLKQVIKVCKNRLKKGEK